MTESRTAERGSKPITATKPFAKISNLIPATSVYSRGTQTDQSQMAAPRIYTHFQLDSGGGAVYSKVPPIGATTTDSGRIIERSVSPRQVQIELEGEHQEQSQKSDDAQEASCRNRRKEGATALAYNIMALDRHELNILASAVQQSDFYVNAGKVALTQFWFPNIIFWKVVLTKASVCSVCNS